MEIKIDPMTEDLRRQRRYLILISFVLCFMKYGGIIIMKTTLFGTEIKFSNISAIFLALWLTWFYFSIRYYQYFMQEGVKKIKSSLDEMFIEKCSSKIESIVKAEHPNVHGTSLNFEYKKSNWHSFLFFGQESIENGVYGNSNAFMMTISLWLLRKEVLKSYYSVFINRSVMTDYLFPVIFAAFTLIYCNIGNWPGQIINIIIKK